MKPLDKEQSRALRKVFGLNIARIRSLPFNMRGIIMYELDRSLSEMERLASSSPSTRATARKCNVCRIPTIRGVYFDGTKHWLCPECADRRQERKERSMQPNPIEEGIEP